MTAGTLTLGNNAMWHRKERTYGLDTLRKGKLTSHSCDVLGWGSNHASGKNT